MNLLRRLLAALRSPEPEEPEGSSFIDLARFGVVHDQGDFWRDPPPPGPGWQVWRPW